MSAIESACDNTPRFRPLSSPILLLPTPRVLDHRCPLNLPAVVVWSGHRRGTGEGGNGVRLPITRDLSMVRISLKRQDLTFPGRRRKGAEGMFSSDGIHVTEESCRLRANRLCGPPFQEANNYQNGYDPDPD